MSKKDKINVQGTEITLFEKAKENYISLTDMAKYKNAEATGLVISHWLSTRYTIRFMGIWEQMFNPDFNVTEFGNIKNESGDNGFVLTSKQWIERTHAIGIIAKPGRYGGGTFAHSDIAFEFATWLSPEFKFLLIKEFKRLKNDENQRLSLEWDLQRTLSKINYRIHTDAIKDEIIPKMVSKEQTMFVYANEADLLNVALFGKTAKEWRDANPNEKGNIRDYATLEQLVVLSNMEMLCKREQSQTRLGYVECRQHSRKKSINALPIRQGLSQSERLVQLNNVAITQMQSLTSNRDLKRLQ